MNIRRHVFPQAEKKQVEKQYDDNNEGCYIVESMYPVSGKLILCFDATRRFHQLGRYMNHARNPNAAITPPRKVRGKWRVGFLAIRDINPGDEVVWDYKIGGQHWSGCRLVGGSVEPSKRMKEVEKESEETDCAFSATARRPRRRLCYCPVEGCTSKPLAKLSNHLAQVHHLNPQQRAKYLRAKRIFASKKDIADVVKKTVIRKSQRTLTSMVKKYTSNSDSESEHDNSGHEEHLALSVDGRSSTQSTFPSISPSSQIPFSCTTQPSSDSVISSPLMPDGPEDSLSMVSKRTDTAGRHPLDSPFLVSFGQYLTTRIGGKKSSSQVAEICTDVSKYLWFADSNHLDSDMLFSRSKIRDFVVHLDNAGIGPSGLMTKLRRLVMAIKYIGLSSEDVVTDNEVMEKARPVEEMISQLCVGLSKEKNLRQCNNLQRFSRQMPDLAGVNKFLTSPEVSTEYAETVTEARSGIVSTTKLSRAMTIVAGRLMLRYVDPYVLYVVMIAVYAMQEWTETGRHNRYDSGGV